MVKKAKATWRKVDYNEAALDEAVAASNQKKVRPAGQATQEKGNVPAGQAAPQKRTVPAGQVAPQKRSVPAGQVAATGKPATTEKAGQSSTKVGAKKANVASTVAGTGPPGKGIPAGRQSGTSAGTKQTEAALADKKAGKAVAGESARKALGVKRPSEVAPEGQNKKSKTDDRESSPPGPETNPAAPSTSLDSREYTLDLVYDSREYMIDNTRACADLCSRLPCNEALEFPKPEELADFEAYRKVSGALVEAMTYTNSLALSYEHKLHKVSTQLVEYESQLKEQESMRTEFESLKGGSEAMKKELESVKKELEFAKKEAEKVPGYEARVSDLRKRLEDTNTIVRDLGSQKKGIEGQLEEAEAKGKSLQEEADRLRESRNKEVRRTVEGCNKRLRDIKRSIDDSAKVADLSTLMSQSRAIKGYLIKMGEEDGITIPEGRLTALDESFKVFEGELNALGEVEVAEDEDFVMPLPDWLSAVPPRVKATSSQAEKVEDRGQLETGAELVGQKSGRKDPDAQPVDHVTGEELGELDGLPVTQAPSAK